MSVGETLDLIDRKILDLLQEDGSLSVAELADRLGMTPPPCWRRVRRLRTAGILDKQVWLVDPASVGLTMELYATVKLHAHDAQATSAFREHVRQLPEIVECYILLGQIDVLLKIVVKDIGYYEEFFYEKLSQLPGVREVNSSVVMTEVKKTTRLPMLM
ncbi:MAG: Lrp/AsnC family transcriptional regulator [Pseudomonadota bacterium]